VNFSSRPSEASGRAEGDEDSKEDDTGSAGVDTLRRDSGVCPAGSRSGEGIRILGRRRYRRDPEARDHHLHVRQPRRRRRSIRRTLRPQKRGGGAARRLYRPEGYGLRHARARIRERRRRGRPSPRRGRRGPTGRGRPGRRQRRGRERGRRGRRSRRRIRGRRQRRRQIGVREGRPVRAPRHRWIGARATGRRPHPTGRRAPHAPRPAL
ncbi:MAG: hypothetical protein AVDCRST_MAG78-3655, partial [uncultured Rubrobacteraceae bacterium]